MKELSINPGKKVGEVLNTLFAEVVEQRLPNERETLINRAKELA
jgi:hypothetical protein